MLPWVRGSTVLRADFLKRMAFAAMATWFVEIPLPKRMELFPRYQGQEVWHIPPGRYATPETIVIPDGVTLVMMDCYVESESPGPVLQFGEMGRNSVVTNCHFVCVA